MEAKFELGEIKTLREQIAAGIRASIIDGRFQPGEKLTEEEIAHQLRVSRTPVREAFFQLVSEGFVDVEPRRGVVVRDISLRDAEETYELKGVLEALAARLAVEHCSSDLIRTLEGINDVLYREVEEQTLSAKEIIDINNNFHLTITEACNNKKLIQQIVALRRQTLRYNYVFLSTVSRLRQSAEEHQAIITALAHRNADEVERLLKLHNDAALDTLRSLMLKKNL